MQDEPPDTARGFGRWLDAYRGMMSPELLAKAEWNLLAKKTLDQPRVCLPLIEAAIADDRAFHDAYEVERLSW